MRGGQRGLVLISVLLVLALLGLATGASLWLTRAELWAAGRARSELQAAYSAEAGVRHALRVLAPDVDWTALVERLPAALAWPDRPGPWAIAGGGWVAFPGPPFGYEVEVVRPTDPRDRTDRLVLRSTSTAVRDARAIVHASVSRAVEPYAPAALVLAGGELEVEAAGHGTPSAPRIRLRASTPVAALGATSWEGLDRLVEAAERADASIDGERHGDVRGFDVARFARRSGLVENPVETLEHAHGSPGEPVAVLVRGGVAPGLSGVGAVVVAGDLDVRGDVEFVGVVLIDGRLRVGAGSSCRVRGLVWATSVAFAGPCDVVADAPAVRSADRVLRLPRLPRLTGLRDG